MLRSITQGAHYKWWALGTIAAGIFMTVMDHGSAAVALPTIASHFGADLPAVQWVVVAYSLSVSVLLLPMGRFSDMVDRKKVYITGFAIYTLAAALSGFSPSLTILIFARVIQGIGSSMVQANMTVMILSIFPGHERGKALGYQTSVVGTGAIVGPALGGLIVGEFGWRYVFLINIPVGIVVIAAAMFILDNRGFNLGAQPGQRIRFDWLGAILSGGALLALLLTISNGNQAGWGSPSIIGGLLVSVALLAGFIWWELRTASPMLELRLFKRKLVALGVSAGWLSFLGLTSGMFMMPFYLQKVQGYSPAESGLIVIFSAGSMAVIGPISGRLSDRYGWRRFKVVGMSMAATAVFIFASTLTENSHLGLIIPVLILQSCGFSLFNVPNNSSILSAVERSRYGVVLALTHLTRNSANVAGVAVATAIVVATMGSAGVESNLESVAANPQAFIMGLHRVFLIMGILMLVGVTLSILQGGRPKEAPAGGAEERKESSEPSSRRTEGEAVSE
ncbi:MAG: MFS transporter [Chloroflexi bacterium]|nr:MFS transporter [Chloroflexota bacterium]